MNKKLILGVTVGGSSRLLDGQPKYFKSLGYEVYLISQDHFKEKLFCEREGIIHLPVDIEKEISPIKDLKTLVQIIKCFRKVKPDIVNVGTFKMGLLGMLSAWILGINNRIYTCRGLRFETEHGFFRSILIFIDKVIIKLSNKVIYVSPSALEVSKKLKIANSVKSFVIEKGSSNGLDLRKFQSKKVDQILRKQLIEDYNLQDKLVIGFVGRVSKHKGPYELVDVFEMLHKKHSNIHLLLLGHLDCSDDLLNKISQHPAINHVPFQEDVPLYMSLFDIFVMSSWREGFPNVPIQAAAMGIPVVISNATGCTDAVEDGFNGKVYTCKDEQSLQISLEYYIVNEQKRTEHGNNGKLWASNFEQTKIWMGINDVYNVKI